MREALPGEESAEGLPKKPKQGKPRKKWLRGKRAGKVLAMRRKYGWEAKVVVAHMKKFHGITDTPYEVRGLLKRSPSQFNGRKKLAHEESKIPSL